METQVHKRLRAATAWSLIGISVVLLISLFGWLKVDIARLVDKMDTMNNRQIRMETKLEYLNGAGGEHGGN